MAPLEKQAGSLKWVARNMAFNLDFIADDKLGWKPAPTAKSALEIVNHSVMAITGMLAWLKTGEMGDMTPASTEGMTRDSAKAKLTAAADDFAAYMLTVKAEDLGKIIPTKMMGDMPLVRLAMLPLMDTMHHHGQIAYIQTLLGDEESHFMNADF